MIWAWVVLGVLALVLLIAQALLIALMRTEIEERRGQE